MSGLSALKTWALVKALWSSRRDDNGGSRSGESNICKHLMCKDAADFALCDIRIRFFVSSSCRAYQQITYLVVAAGVYNCTCFWLPVINNFCPPVAQCILFEIWTGFVNIIHMKFRPPTVNSCPSVDPVVGSLLCTDVSCIVDLSKALNFLSSESKELVHFCIIWWPINRFLRQIC